MPSVLDVIKGQPIEEEYEEIDRKEEKLFLCGQSGCAVLNPHTGKFTYWPYYCKDWRNCPTCFKIKVEKIQGQLAAAFTPHLFIWEASDEECKALSKKIESKKDFRIFPLRESSIIIFRDWDENLNIGKRLSYDGIKSIDVERILREKPLNRRESGQLGKSSTVDKKGKMPTKCVCTPLEQGKLRQVIEQAIEATKDLDPKDRPSLEEAIKVRTSKVCELLDEMGAIYWTEERTIDLSEKDINWKNPVPDFVDMEAEWEKMRNCKKKKK